MNIDYIANYEWPAEWVTALTAPACSLVRFTLEELKYDDTFGRALAGNRSLRELLLAEYRTALRAGTPIRLLASHHSCDLLAEADSFEEVESALLNGPIKHTLRVLRVLNAENMDFSQFKSLVACNRVSKAQYQRLTTNIVRAYAPVCDATCSHVRAVCRHTHVFGSAQ